MLLCTVEQVWKILDMVQYRSGKEHYQAKRADVQSVSVSARHVWDPVKSDLYRGHAWARTRGPGQISWGIHLWHPPQT